MLLCQRTFYQNQSGIREIEITGEPAPAHFRSQIEYFAADMQNNSRPTPGADDVIRALKILEAIYESELTAIDIS